MRIEDRSIQIEWEATVGHWSLPLKTYLALGTSVDIVARVSAELGNLYHAWSYGKANRYQNVTLRTSDNYILNGYLSRYGPTYDELMDILKDGKSHELTLALANADDDTEYPVITKLLSKSWIYDGEPVK